jgi:hypothetical protein
MVSITRRGVGARLHVSPGAGSGSVLGRPSPKSCANHNRASQHPARHH